MIYSSNLNLFIFRVKWSVSVIKRSVGAEVEVKSLDFALGKKIGKGAHETPASNTHEYNATLGRIFGPFNYSYRSETVGKHIF